jgi:peptide/nickel transport system ATP-binding protein
MSEALARLDGLGVTYAGAAQAALDGVTLDIREGERLAIIGESGSGKSTLALALAGLLPPGAAVSGHVTWPLLGRMPVPGRDYGFVFQDAGASLNPVLSAGEQVAEVLVRHAGLGWREAGREAVERLAHVKLPDPEKIARAFPHQLSGGQRQRVAIAAAVAARPRLLIADEPTSALDTIVQAEIVALLDGLVREAGMTLLFITHDIALASGFADRIAVFRHARLVEAGDAAALLAAPREDYTRRLIGSHIDLATAPLMGAA